MIEFMKAKYRIDAFPLSKKVWFDDRMMAIRYGLQELAKGKLVYLLEFRADNDYTVTDIRSVRS